MPGLNLKTANIISLTKLEIAVRREYACRFNLADDPSLFTLLKLASESSNSKIKMAYFQFFEGLPREEKDKILSQSNSEPIVQQTSNQTTHTYRGVTSHQTAQSHENKFSGNDRTTPQSHAEFQQEINKKNKVLPDGVTKITYRGNVVYKKDGEIIENPFDPLLETPSSGSSRKAKRNTQGKHSNHAKSK